MTADDFFLTNLELRESTETGEQGEGLSHRSMAGLVLLTVLELAARGEPRGAVTVLHDAGDHGGRYRALARSLADAGWAVALPDLRGHGLSEGPRGHSNGIPEVVRDVGDVQDHLAYRMPDAPKVLVGQGLGALYALAFALERPGVVRGLVLVAPLHEPRFELPEAPTGLKKLFKKVGAASPGRIAYAPEQLSSDGEALRAWRADSRVHDVITLRAAEQASHAAREYLPRIGQTGLPVLVLHGSADPIASAERSRALAGEGIEVEVLEGLRHHPLQERGAERVHAAIVDWLDRRLPR